MEEIKAGDYIRLDDGTIGIVKYIDTQNIGIITNNDEIEVSSGIVSNSSNIIDLVEVGDYVNGKEVKHIADFEGVKEPIRKLIFVDEHRLVPGETAKNDEIKSIVTKEQFENAEYKLDN